MNIVCLLKGGSRGCPVSVDRVYVERGTLLGKRVYGAVLVMLIKIVGRVGGGYGGRGCWGTAAFALGSGREWRVHSAYRVNGCVGGARSGRVGTGSGIRIV